MHTNLTDPIGMVEIAAMLGYPKKTVWVWRDRGQLPAEAAVVSSTPLWERATILAWATETGRAGRMA